MLFISPDYRNFPQGLAGDMLVDVDQAINWIFENIAQYGGDPSSIYILGQSAGAHLAALALADKALEEHKKAIMGLNARQRSEAKEKKTSWKASAVKQFVGVSGAYNLRKLAAHLHMRGLHKSVLYTIMEGELSRFSPVCRLKDLRKYGAIRTYPRSIQDVAWPANTADNLSGSDVEEPEILTEDGEEIPDQKDSDEEIERVRFPPTALLHGKKDVTIPYAASYEMGRTLESLGVPVSVKSYEGKTHTDCVIEDVFLGKNPMLEDMVQIVVGGEDEEEYYKHRAQRLKLYEKHKLSVTFFPTVVKIARWINPF